MKEYRWPFGKLSQTLPSSYDTKKQEDSPVDTNLMNDNENVEYPDEQRRLTAYPWIGNSINGDDDNNNNKHHEDNATEGLQLVVSKQQEKNTKLDSNNYQINYQQPRDNISDPSTSEQWRIQSKEARKKLANVPQTLQGEKHRQVIDKERQAKLKAAGDSSQAKKSHRDLNLSFCGCGFLGIYHVGVASCLLEYAPQLSLHKISGSSAGALVAVAHICGNLQLAYATTDILRVAIDARSRTLGPLHPSFDINAIVREALERDLPDDVHLKASGKLHVSLTRVRDGENVIISEFSSKEDVIQVLLCSCFIPFWSGLKAPKYRGVTYIDGGFSNNLLVLDDKTVTVSPFAGEADICPLDDTFNLLQVNLSNTSFSLSPNNLYRLSHALLPPEPEVLSDLCEQGFADAIRYLQRMNLISCTRCLEIRSSVVVTTSTDTSNVINSATSQSYTCLVDSCTGCGTCSPDTCPVAAAEAASGEIVANHIRLEQQEHKMTASRRRDSVVSTGGQIFLRQHQTSLSSRPSSVSFHNLMDTYDGADELHDDQLEECDECDLIRQRALTERALPKQFSDRIRLACDTVNKSLSNWIYSHRPIKYLSYLAAPYYLPIDLTLALIYKCWQRLPDIRSELVDCVHNLVDFLMEILKRMQSQSTTALLMESSSRRAWASDEAIERELIKYQNIHCDVRIPQTYRPTPNTPEMGSASPSRLLDHGQTAGSSAVSSIINLVWRTQVNLSQVETVSV